VGGTQKELAGSVRWLSRFYCPFSVLLKFVANFGLVDSTNMLLSCESLIDKNLKFVANFGLVDNINMLLSCESLISEKFTNINPFWSFSEKYLDIWILNDLRVSPFG
jgi:hypothetical protein